MFIYLPKVFLSSPSDNNNLLDIFCKEFYYVKYSHHLNSLLNPFAHIRKAPLNHMIFLS